MDLRAKTCCFTGHRNLSSGEKLKAAVRLREIIAEQIKAGVVFYGAGGALGFDTLAAKTVLEMKKEYPQLRLILVLPCENQTRGWRSEDIAVYEDIKINSRWVNITVKAFGQALCERIRKMELKEGSMINLIGRYDEDTWTDEETKEKKSMPVIILDDLEFCFSGSKKSDGGQSGSGNGANHAPAPGQSYGYGAPQYGGYAPAAAPGYPPTEDSMPGNFTGFEPFGSGSNFFDE